MKLFLKLRYFKIITIDFRRFYVHFKDQPNNYIYTQVTINLH